MAKICETYVLNKRFIAFFAQKVLFTQNKRICGG